jgi:phage-related protein
MVIVPMMRVVFHKSRSDRAYIEDFLADLDARDRATILAAFIDIRDCGFDAKGCQFRQIDGKLWEIKVRAPGGGYRFFYAMLRRDEMYVLHAYQKKGQKAPVRELDVARKRMREVLL